MQRSSKPSQSPDSTPNPMPIRKNPPYYQNISPSSLDSLFESSTHSSSIPSVNFIPSAPYTPGGPHIPRESPARRLSDLAGSISSAVLSLHHSHDSPKSSPSPEDTAESESPSREAPSKALVATASVKEKVVKAKRVFWRTRRFIRHPEQVFNEHLGHKLLNTTLTFIKDPLRELDRLRYRDLDTLEREERERSVRSVLRPQGIISSGSGGTGEVIVAEDGEDGEGEDSDEENVLESEKLSGKFDEEALCGGITKGQWERGMQMEMAFEGSLGGGEGGDVWAVDDEEEVEDGAVQEVLDGGKGVGKEKDGWVRC